MSLSSSYRTSVEMYVTPIMNLTKQFLERVSEYITLPMMDFSKLFLKNESRNIMFPIINFTVPFLSELVSECIILHKINLFKTNLLFFILFFLFIFLFVYFFYSRKRSH